jgi:hypothetical protein
MSDPTLEKLPTLGDHDSHHDEQRDNSWHHSPELYAELMQSAFAIGEQHARAIVINQLAVPGDNADGDAYSKMADAVYELYPEEDQPPFDAGYAVGLAVGLGLSRGAS